MSKMTCIEEIYDALVGGIASEYLASAATEHECFEDILNGCFALASGESNDPDVAAWIAANDNERSEMEVCLDICDYFRKFYGAAKPSEVMARAIAAGKGAI